VGGPEALTPLEVVKIFEEESGRCFEVETIPEAKLREQFELATDPLEKSFAEALLQYAQGETVALSIKATTRVRISCALPACCIHSLLCVILEGFHYRLNES
jgi:hypothetical protein